MTSTPYWIVLGCALAIGIAALAFFGEKAKRRTALVGEQAKFQLVQGCFVADMTGIHECYSVQAAKGYHVLVINVSAENIPSTFLHLAQLLNGPVFFTIEVGSNRDVEGVLRKSDTDPLHKDVYYLDGLSPGGAREIFKRYSHLLTHDGMVNFGIGSHKANDEVFVQRYKIFNVYTIEPEKYRKALNALGFREERKIKTVWENFTEALPGFCSSLESPPMTVGQALDEIKTVAPEKYRNAVNPPDVGEEPKIKTIRENVIPAPPAIGIALENPPKTVSQMIDELKQRGLHFAERREH